MNIRVLLASLTGVAVAATFALPLFADDAMAAKEKFQRTKPHVNVGTIDHVDNPNQLTAPAGTASTTGDPGASDCKPDPSKPADAQTC